MKLIQGTNAFEGSLGFYYYIFVDLSKFPFQTIKIKHKTVKAC